eukprot:895266-Prymnesium_polylepis.1
MRINLFQSWREPSSYLEGPPGLCKKLSPSQRRPVCVSPSGSKDQAFRPTPTCPRGGQTPQGQGPDPDLPRPL